MATVPDQLTVAELTRKVNNFVGGIDDSETEALCIDGLNSAIGLINSRRWNKIHTYEDLTLVADTSTYTVDNSCKEAMGAWRLNSSTERDGRLHYRSLKTMLEERPIATESGNPYIYSLDIKNRNFVLEIPPSSAFVSSYPKIRFYYYYRQDELASGGSAPVLDPDFQWFLIWHARAELAAIRRPKLFAYAEGKAQQMWRQLTRNDTDQQPDWDSGAY